MVADRLRRLRVPPRVLVAVAVVAVLVAAVVVWATHGRSGPSYRTARAELASVDQTLDSVGTVSSASKVSASFPVAGTVSGVAVSLGQQITAGQRLATLDTTSLKQQVNSAADSLTSSRQTLADAEDGELESTSASSTSLGSGSSGSGGNGNADSTGADSYSAVRLTADVTPPASSSSAPAPSASGSTAANPGQGPSSGSSTGPGGSSGSGGSSTSGSIASLQQKVIKQQQLIDANLLTLRGPDGKSGTLGQANACTTDQTADCSTLLQQVADLENTIASEQATQQQYEAALDEAISAAQTSGSHGGSGTGSSGGGTGKGSGTGKTGSSGTGGYSGTGSGKGSSGRTGSGSTGSTGSSGSTTTTVSAAQLAAYQAHVDEAKANLTMAKQNLAAATLTSPISGTVADVSITSGQQVSADSANATITVIGGGAARVETTVALSNIDQVKIGETASVVVDGVSTPLTGTVSYIGVLDTTTGSSTTFPVDVQLASDSPRLYDGVAASVSITVATAKNVLTVPTSAVHAIGTLHTVTVLDSGKASVVQVKVGAADGVRTQITSGLRAGQQVVLADLSEPLPTNDTTNRLGGGLTGVGGTGRIGLTRFSGGGGAIVRGGG